MKNTLRSVLKLKDLDDERKIPNFCHPYKIYLIDCSWLHWWRKFCINIYPIVNLVETLKKHYLLHLYTRLLEKRSLLVNNTWQTVEFLLKLPLIRTGIWGIVWSE